MTNWTKVWVSTPVKHNNNSCITKQQFTKSTLNSHSYCFASDDRQVEKQTKQIRVSEIREVKQSHVHFNVKQKTEEHAVNGIYIYLV